MYNCRLPVVSTIVQLIYVEVKTYITSSSSWNLQSLQFDFDIRCVLSILFGHWSSTKIEF